MKRTHIYIIIVILLCLSALALINNAIYLSMQRNIAYLIFQNKMEVYEGASRQLESTSQMLSAVQTAPEPWNHGPYLVVSIAEHYLWYKQEGKVIFKAPVATGSEKTLVRLGNQQTWRFDTPRGRMVVQDKQEDPIWVPPDWHYVEQSRLKGVTLFHLDYGKTLTLSDASVVSVVGYNVVRRQPNGATQILTASEKKEIILDGMLVIPPLGTTARRYKGVLGPYSLELGDGYAIHGTDQPESIGHSVSHGCVRMYNEDITKLFKLVKIGTPVYIY